MADGEKKLGFFARLKSGLTKTRDNIVAGMNLVFLGHTSIDDDFYEELEEIMILGDMGVQTTDRILEQLRTQVKELHIKEPVKCRDLLIEDIRGQMQVDEHAYDFENGPSVVLVIGVNGGGTSRSASSEPEARVFVRCFVRQTFTGMSSCLGLTPTIMPP